MSDSPDNPRAVVGGNNPPEPTLIEKMTEAVAPIVKDLDALAAKANALPKTIKSDDENLEVGAVVKEARSISKRVEALRVETKAPIIKAGKDVEAFFSVPADRLARIITTLEERGTAFVNAKAAEERRLREEQARIAREKAEEERRKADAAANAGRVQTAARAEGRAEAAEDQARRLEMAAEKSNADLVRTRGAGGTVATAKTKQDIRIVNFAEADLATLRPYLDRDAVLKAARAWLKVTKGTEALKGFEVFDDVKASYR